MALINPQAEEISVQRKPQKKYYRQRAHSNPIADHCFDYPLTPDDAKWSDYFTTGPSKGVDFLDVGCGYGGLLVELSPMFPDKHILGLEIRVKVCDYVQDRIKALRTESPEQYGNIACIRTNAMKYLPNFLRKGELEKLFFLFPDPHFKRQKHKWRIISTQLLAEYAYVLAIGATVYIATDVKELYEWMCTHFTNHPLFLQLTEAEASSDPVVPKLFDSTEEGKKVTRMGGEKFIAAFRRIADPFETK